MTYSTLLVDGKRYVLVPEDEYELLRSRPLVGEEPNLPRLPEMGPDRMHPAIEYARVSLARKLILARRRVGLSQAELARRAEVRVETLNRIEKGRQSTSAATVEKIDRALKAAASAAPVAEHVSAKLTRRPVGKRAGQRRSK